MVRHTTGALVADMEAAISEALNAHPAITAVRLVGSRARGDAGPLSDWDFSVETRDFRSVADALQALVAPLQPLAQQWDRLSAEQCYMLMLSGPVKVDLIFDEPHGPEPPWAVSAETVRGIDDHFWDWTLWLAGKDRAGKAKLVKDELRKMHEHLLAPLGVAATPAGIHLAVADYLDARKKATARLRVGLSREVEQEVLHGLQRHGFGV